MNEIRYPHLAVFLTDRTTSAVINTVSKRLRQAGVEPHIINQFRLEAADSNSALVVARRWLSVNSG